MYVCPTTTFSLVLSVISVFVRFAVSSVVSTPSTNTFMSSIVICSVVSKYLSVAVNTIVSVFAVSSFVADCFSILGFMKSTYPSSNSCSLLVFECPSVLVIVSLLFVAEPSAIAQQLYVCSPPYVSMFPPVSVFVPVFCELNRTSDDRVTRMRTPA